MHALLCISASSGGALFSVYARDGLAMQCTRRYLPFQLGNLRGVHPDSSGGLTSHIMTKCYSCSKSSQDVMNTPVFSFYSPAPRQIFSKCLLEGIEERILQILISAIWAALQREF